MHKSHMRMMLRTWYVLPACLLLITIGVRVPNLVGHHTPKHHPRAIFETASKTSQDAASENIVVADLSESLPRPVAPEQFRVRFSRETCRFSSTTPPHSGARAPPG